MENVAYKLLCGLMQKLKNNEPVDVETQVNILAFAIEKNVPDVFARVVTYNPCISPEAVRQIVDLYPNRAHDWLDRADLGPDFLQTHNLHSNDNNPRYEIEDFELMRSAPRRQWLQLHSNQALHALMLYSNDPEVVLDVLYAKYELEHNRASDEEEKQSVDAAAVDRLEKVFQDNLMLSPENKTRVYLEGPTGDYRSISVSAYHFVGEVKMLCRDQKVSAQPFIDAMWDYVTIEQILPVFVSKNFWSIDVFAPYLDVERKKIAKQYLLRNFDDLPSVVISRAVSYGLLDVDCLESQTLTSVSTADIWETQLPLDGQLVDFVAQNNISVRDLTMLNDLLVNNDKVFPVSKQLLVGQLYDVVKQATCDTD